MIQYVCDCCKRTIDVEHEVRYVARLEVYAAVDPMAEDEEDERDHLEEIQEMLERLDVGDSSEVAEEVYHRDRLDLCGQCRNRFVKNPLGRLKVTELGFSKN